MKSSQQLLKESSLRRQIQVIRFANGLAKHATPLYKTEPDLRKVLDEYYLSLQGKALYTKASRKKLRSFKRDIVATRKNAWAEVSVLIKKDLRDFAKAEILYNREALEAALVVKYTVTNPVQSDVLQEVAATLYHGKTIDEHFYSARQADANRLVSRSRVGLSQDLDHKAFIGTVLGNRNLGYRNGASRKFINDLNAITQTVTNGTRQVAYNAVTKANPFAFDEEVFIATLDGGTTMLCAGLDGKRFKINEGRQPPLHYHCRSLRMATLSVENLSTRAYVPTTENMLAKEYAKANNLKRVGNRNSLPRGHKGAFDEYARKRKRELIGETTSSENFDQFMKGQSKEFQDEYFGPTRAKMYRNGEVPLTGFTNDLGVKYTLDDLSKLGYTVPTH